MSIALRHFQVAPDYRISVITLKDKKTGSLSKIRVHKRKVKRKFRTFLAYMSLPRSVRFRHKLK